MWCDWLTPTLTLWKSDFSRLSANATRAKWSNGSIIQFCITPFKVNEDRGCWSLNHICVNLAFGPDGRLFFTMSSSSSGNHKSLPALNEELNLTTKQHLLCMLLKAEWVRGPRWSGDKGSYRQLFKGFRSENIIEIKIRLLSQSLKKSTHFCLYCSHECNVSWMSWERRRNWLWLLKVRITVTPCPPHFFEYLRNNWRDFCYIWKKCSIQLKDELIRIWSLKGHYDFTKDIFLVKMQELLIITSFYTMDKIKILHWICRGSNVNLTVTYIIFWTSFWPIFDPLNL